MFVDLNLPILNNAYYGGLKIFVGIVGFFSILPFPKCENKVLANRNDNKLS